jgi:hypothetical protein
MGGITEVATSAPGYNSILPNTASPIAKTLKLNGYSTAQFGKCHEVPVSSELAPFNFAILPPDQSLVVLSTVDDYSLVAGPIEFINALVGNNIREAWDSFEKEALDSSWQGRLQKVADRYRIFSSKFS